MNFGRTLISGATYQQQQHSRQQTGDGGNLQSRISGHRNLATWQKAMDSDTHHSTLIVRLKNIINGLISPVTNFDLGPRNLSRHKFVGSGTTGISNELIPTHPPQEDRLKTAILGLGVDTANLSQIQSMGTADHRMDARSEAEVVAVHTSEEFPELHPAPDLCQPSKAGCSFSRNSQTETRKFNRQNPDPPECDSSEDSFVIFGDSGVVNCSSLKQQKDPAGMCNRSRQRQISECSDDSFVIYFADDAPEGIIEIISDDETDNEHDGHFDSESETDTELASDDDEEDAEEMNEDQTDGITRFVQNPKGFCDSGGTNQPDSGFDEQKPLKRVRFNLKPEVHMMYAWNYAYRASRRGHWDMYARDRDRFQRRIKCLAEILNPVLDREHRERIFQTRFCDNTNVEQLEPLKGNK